MTVNSFSSTKCKGSGTGQSSGTPFTFTFATEAIPGVSSNPNHILATLSAMGMSEMVILERL